MLGIIDLSKFNYEELEEIVAGGQGSLLLLFISHNFLVRMMIKFRIK